MCDALQELSDLSLDLQKSDMGPYMMNKKIYAVVHPSHERQTVPGPYYTDTAKAT